MINHKSARTGQVSGDITLGPEKEGLLNTLKEFLLVLVPSGRRRDFSEGRNYQVFPRSSQTSIYRISGRKSKLTSIRKYTVNRADVICDLNSLNTKLVLSRNWLGK